MEWNDSHIPSNKIMKQMPTVVFIVDYWSPQGDPNF